MLFRNRFFFLSGFFLFHWLNTLCVNEMEKCFHSLDLFKFTATLRLKFPLWFSININFCVTELSAIINSFKTLPMRRIRFTMNQTEGVYTTPRHVQEETSWRQKEVYFCVESLMSSSLRMSHFIHEFHFHFVLLKRAFFRVQHFLTQFWYAQSTNTYIGNSRMNWRDEKSDENIGIVSSECGTMGAVSTNPIWKKQINHRRRTNTKWSLIDIKGQISIVFQTIISSFCLTSADETGL